MNDVCIVTINGEDWYIPCDRVNDIGLDTSGNLVNLSSSSLTLYDSFVTDTSSLYPRVRCDWGRVCYVQTDSNTYNYLTSATLEVKNRAVTDDLFVSFMLAIVCIGVLLWNFWKH